MGERDRSRAPRRSTEALRHDLLEAARAVFSERGFSATTTRDVAQRAGTVEPLIYRHFKTKAGLFAAAIFEPLNEAFEALLERLDRDPAARTRAVDTLLLDYATSLLQVLRKNRRAIIAFVNAATFHADEFRDRGHAPIPSLIAHLNRLQRIGARRSTNDVTVVDPLMETRLSFALVLAVAVFEDLLLDKSERNEARELAGIVKLLSIGLGAPRPAAEAMDSAGTSSRRRRQ